MEGANSGTTNTSLNSQGLHFYPQLKAGLQKGERVKINTPPCEATAGIRTWDFRVHSQMI